MGLFNAVMALSGMIDTDVVEDERLARHTSYRIGGKADLFVTCHSYHALRRAVAVLDREQVPWVIIGKGSNLLVADAGYRGAVISLGREFQRTVVAEDGCTLTVGAGVMFARLVNDALSRGLSGLEFAVGIPGSVGGAVSMNAGTRTEWIGSLIEDVVTFDPDAPEGDAPADADTEPVAETPAEPEPAEPQDVPSFDDEPQMPIDTEGAVAENHEAPAAVFGGAATAPSGSAHEGNLPLVDGAGENPAATVAMPAMPQE